MLSALKAKRKFLEPNVRRCESQPQSNCSSAGLPPIIYSIYIYTSCFLRAWIQDFLDSHIKIDAFLVLRFFTRQPLPKTPSKTTSSIWAVSSTSLLLRDYPQKLVKKWCDKNWLQSCFGELKLTVLQRVQLHWHGAACHSGRNSVTKYSSATADTFFVHHFADTMLSSGPAISAKPSTLAASASSTPKPTAPSSRPTSTPVTRALLSSFSTNDRWVLCTSHLFSSEYRDPLSS